MVICSTEVFSEEPTSINFAPATSIALSYGTLNWVWIITSFFIPVVSGICSMRVLSVPVIAPAVANDKAEAAPGVINADSLPIKSATNLRHVSVNSFIST